MTQTTEMTKETITARPPKLIDYVRSSPSQPLPQPVGVLYQYVLAANGVFIRAEREGLRACIQIASCDVRGLTPLEAEVEFLHPRVPADAVAMILDISRRAQMPGGGTAEVLFHLELRDAEWVLTVPEQEATSVGVKPLGAGQDSSYARCIIEAHSHHNMSPFWSREDDKDEQGFRLYAVLGDIFKRPRLRVRVGVYGYFHEIDASNIFDLPEGVYEHEYE
jgi:PRTRC genetic system protein A